MNHVNKLNIAHIVTFGCNIKTTNIIFSADVFFLSCDLFGTFAVHLNVSTPNTNNFRGRKSPSSSGFSTWQIYQTKQETMYKRTDNN